ncbi:uncharacterized protein K02A2.6-like [Leguminivora glycinivorella]|uniref:uncharacterized protein K02A2.6-like n=1 Tax=Leguminivora glycinivorella TaxID=1035111 RepID=UPI00200DF2A4|nr:uncharacterized protein K02A2.6-like [Leguminivora glycinivorella]
MMYISDTLSRAALPESNKHKIDSDITIHANMFKNSLAVSDDKLQIIKQETLKDVELQKLKEYFFNGWPKHKNNTDVNVRCYWSYRAEIHIIDDIVFKNTSIIIPASMRKDMLQKIHASHAGINRCKNLARGVLFWPSMSSDIEQFVENCIVCLKYRTANTSEPLIVSDSPSYPWEKIGADLLQFRDKKYLVIIDYYSKYIELAYLNTGTSAKHVILQFKSVLARHGSPLVLMTDNGPPFDSREFASFCQEWDIQHITSSPHFPQSNGQAESAVKIVKRILEKSFEDNTDPYLALLHYRCNEKEYMKSPAELLMSRKLRSNLPMSKELLKPKVVQYDTEQRKMNKYKKQLQKVP